MKMNKAFSVLLFNLLLLPSIAYGDAQPDLKGAYQPATVISVKKVPTPANYVYEIGFQLNCTIYVARYKSAYEYVIPEALSPKSNVNVRLTKNWVDIYLEPERHVEMRLLSTSRMNADTCSANQPSIADAGVIPAGTILPISMTSSLRSDKDRPGAPVTATLMQDVLLGEGVTLPKGSKVMGHVLEVSRSQPGSEASISFLFDKVQFGSRTISVATNLRALASAMAVSATRTPKANNDNASTWSYVQIGGDQVSYGQDGPVALGSEVVGKYTSQGALAYLTADLGTECRSAIDGNNRPQSFWVFSSRACGVYWSGDVKILHAGRTDPVGQITLVSEGKTVSVGKGSGMLLRVDRSGSGATVPETAASFPQNPAR
jgi:hypothetical protein